MSDTSPSPDGLTARLLIAMPGMSDPRFRQSVIYLCAHSPEGAMGLMVNKPATAIRFPDLLDQLEIARGPEAEAVPIRHGGPVEHARGFVLHSADYLSENGSMRITEDMAMSATLDILENMARGTGPARALFALGYAGWGPGQLDSEIAENGWIVTDAEPEIIFDDEDATKWSRALATLGIDPMTLSSVQGRA